MLQLVCYSILSEGDLTYAVKWRYGHLERTQVLCATDPSSHKVRAGGRTCYFLLVRPVATVWSDCLRLPNAVHLLDIQIL